MRPEKLTSKERVEHVLNAITLIQKFIENQTLENFSIDHKTYSACIYQYTIIWEAVANIDNEILDKYPYPWFKVKSFRNFIVHEYQAVDERVVWDTTRIILPELEELMENILKNEF